MTFNQIPGNASVFLDANVLVCCPSNGTSRRWRPPSASCTACSPTML
jgi:hypothetical protein